jgi:hypothetical protein
VSIVTLPFVALKSTQARIPAEHPSMNLASGLILSAIHVIFEMLDLRLGINIHCTPTSPPITLAASPPSSLGNLRLQPHLIAQLESVC